MGNFVHALSNYSNITRTENGGAAVSTLDNPLLDLFAMIGGMRKADDNRIISMWKSARSYNRELADNLILYSRNIRDGGLGERRVGRILLKELARIEPAKVTSNLQKIVDAGRWDDLFIFEGTKIENEVWNFIKAQLIADVKNMKANKPVSLLAKWMPSINTSSAQTRQLARKLCVIFGLTPRIYRKTLSTLRNYIDVVERKMSAGRWDEINFEGVPSVAMSRYITAFNKHVPNKFSEYKLALSKGEAKVNASTLYPYDIIRKAFCNNKIYYDEVSEAQWKALPDYLKNNKDEVLFVVDTSGSMTYDEYKPISTAIGLGLYFAQRNKGAFHNMFMTFSDRPRIHKIQDHWSLTECVKHIYGADWGWNTNLDASFKLIYDIAELTNDVPKALVIVSDMQIDQWSSEDRCNTITSKWQKEFAKIGLTAPKLIYWNVNNGSNTFLARPEDKVSFISGYGVSQMKYLTTLIEKSAYDSMVEVLSQPAFRWD